MRRIRPWLYIGSYRNCCDLSLLRVNQITAILQLAGPVESDECAVLTLPLEDGAWLPPELLRQGVDFIHAEREAGGRVLVGCGAGISRSTTFALAALKEHEGLDLTSALQAIRAQHPDAMPNLYFWEQLGQLYAEPAPLHILYNLPEPFDG